MVAVSEKPHATILSVPHLSKEKNCLVSFWREYMSKRKDRINSQISKQTRKHMLVSLTKIEYNTRIIEHFFVLTVVIKYSWLQGVKSGSNSEELLGLTTQSLWDFHLTLCIVAAELIMHTILYTQVTHTFFTIILCLSTCLKHVVVRLLNNELNSLVDVLMDGGTDGWREMTTTRRQNPKSLF